MKRDPTGGARSILGFYNAVLLAFAPALLLKKAIKFGRRGHNHEWDLARWKAPPRLEKSGPRVVFVALSWGEIGILEALSRRLESDFDGLEIVWSIRDKGAQQMAQEKFPARRIVSMPFDFALPAANWLESVAPDVLIVVEKFWWPNLIHGAKARGAKIVLVNGRSRGRNKLRYRILSGFQRWILRAFDLLLFESESQIERVRAVLPRGARVQATGNIKFAFEAPATKNEAGHEIGGAQSLENWLASRARDSSGPLPLLVAGSTSPIDEEWALDAFEKVKTEIPCALLIAPRRSERAGEIARIIAARGLKVSRRSAEVLGAPDLGAEVLVLDTLGELFSAYGWGIAAYVGGAVEGRGHNLIEPLAHGIPVSYGPNRGDFEGAQRAAEEWNVGFRLGSSGGLADFYKKSLRDSAFRDETAVGARKLIESQRGALDATLTALQPILNQVARRG